MRFLGRVPTNAAARRWIAVLAITLGAWLLALLPRATSGTRAIHDSANEYFYDTYYRLRPIESQQDGPVVIIAVDQRSLDAVKKAMGYGWPWPRELFGHVAAYASEAGAKAVVFDMYFSEPSAYQSRTGDDDTFADQISGAKCPVVIGSELTPDGKWAPLGPPVKAPVLGAVHVGDDKVFRTFSPIVQGHPSLAAAAIKAAGRDDKLAAERPFLLHFYGPHETRDAKRTFRYVSAASVLTAQLQGKKAAEAAGITPEMFRGKIVLVGAITTGTFDLKSTPLSREYPGVEVQATAIANMLTGQQVRPVSFFWLLISPLLCAAFVTLLVIFPRRVVVKLLGPVLAIVAVVGLGILLFHAGNIAWLPPVSPLGAIAVATLGSFSWVYLAEDRQRRFMLKALSKIVSPAVAQQLARDPERLALGTIRTDLTILFTDLADFTGQCEGVDGQRLTDMLNRYLGEMSDQVLAHDGTLDKYIGDAIMCFWNAPLAQEDHAARACRAALAIVRREREIQDQLRAYGFKQIYTRIGINTASVRVGFIGSDHLFNYTALGDGVNLASRLEGANKLYGTRIVVADSTAQLVKDRFLLRKLDVLRVKGKKQPMAVYELLAEKGEEDGLLPLVKGYEAAFADYQSRRWNDAQRQLLELQASFSDDGASRALLNRVAHCRDEPPPDDWDGVYVAKEK